MPLRLKGDSPKEGSPDRRYYMIDVQVGLRRERLSTGTRDRQLAERKEQHVLDALRDDPEVSRLELQRIVRGERLASLQAARDAAKSWSLKEACDECLGDRDGGWADAKSISSYESNCRLLQAALGADTPVSFIDQVKVTAVAKNFLNVAKNSTATVNRKMFALMHVLGYAKKHGQYLGDLPKFTYYDEKGRSREFVLTAADEAVLFNAILALDDRPPANGTAVITDAADYLDYFTFLADIGCRASQGMKVRWRDVVELQPGISAIRFWRSDEQKGGRVRTTPCTDRVARILKRRRALGGLGPFSGLAKWRATYLWNLAKAATPLAGEKECVPHCLRHTCATRLLAKTGDLKLVQEWLGHTKIETTAMIYTKVLVDTKLSALSALQEGWNGTSPIAGSGTIRDGDMSLDRVNDSTRH